MDWFGRAKIDFTSSPEPLILEEKDGSKTDLRKICEAATPPCQLNPLLFNGHLQTFWTAVNTEAPHIYYRRKIFDANHRTYNGTFAVDFAVAPHNDADATLPPRTAYYAEEDFAKIGSDDSRPMLIVLHGLSGGSHEVYLRHSIEPLLADGENWAVCVVNSRGCANSAITSGVLFNARATWDVRQVCTRIIERDDTEVELMIDPILALDCKLGSRNLSKPATLWGGLLLGRLHIDKCKEPLAVPQCWMIPI